MNKKNSNLLNNFIKLIVLLVIGVAAGYALLCAVYLLPCDIMQKNLKRSEVIFTAEEDYRRVIPGYISTQLDTYTDAWMLGISVYEEDAPLLTRVLSCNREQSGSGPKESIVSYLDRINHDGTYEAGTDREVVGYPRYWHGYLVALKPLLMIFSYADIRVFNMFAQTFIVMLICAELLKRNHKREIFAYIMSILFIMPIVIPLSIQFSVIFYVANIAMYILLRKYETFDSRGMLFLFFELTGMCTSYFDFLTYPIATLGMPLCVLIMIEQDKGENVFNIIKRIIQNSISWGFGYAAMWASKWFLASIVLHENIIMNAVSQITMRTGTVAENEKISLIETVLRNAEFYFNPPHILIVIASVALLMVILIKTRTKLSEFIKSSVPWLMVACYPFAWYILARQHSYEHHWFTFRGLMVTVFACLNILVCAMKRHSDKAKMEV